MQNVQKPAPHNIPDNYFAKHYSYIIKLLLLWRFLPFFYFFGNFRRFCRNPVEVSFV